MEFSTAAVVFIVYLMNQVDTWVTVSKHLLGGIATVTCIWAFVTALTCSDNSTQFKDSLLYKNFKKILTVVFLLITVSACTPSKESVMQMGIAFGASEVIKSDAAAKVAQEISQISGKTAKVVNKKLDKMLEEK